MPAFIRIRFRAASSCSHPSRTALPVRPASRPDRGRSSRARPPVRRRAAVFGPIPRIPGSPSDGSPDKGAEVAPLRCGDAVAGLDVRGADNPLPWLAGCVEDADALAQELVVVLVPGHDHDRSAARACGEGSDDVVGFLVADLDPADAAGVQAALDVGEGLDGRRRPRGPVRLVAGVEGLALGGAVLAVEDGEDLRRLADVVAQAGRSSAKNPKTPVRSRSLSRLVIRAGNP